MTTEHEALFDYAVQDMALVNRHTVVLSGLGPFVGDEPDVRGSSRIIVRNLETDIWAFLHYDYGQRWKVGAGMLPGRKRRVLYGSADFTALIQFQDGPTTNDPGRLRSPAIVSKIALIGSHFYACGGNEFFGRRDDFGEWTYLSLATTFKNTRFDFEQMAGNSEDNIYLVPGDFPFSLAPADDPNFDERPYIVAHWDGNKLQLLPYPAGLEHDGRKPIIRSIAVAPDGQVFLGGLKGELLVGNVATGFFPLLYPEKTGDDNPKALKALAWYQDSLWAVDGIDLLRLVDGKWQVQTVKVGDTTSLGADYLFSGDGALLLGSQSNAALFDGTSWRRIFGYINTDDWFTLKLQEQQKEDMEDLLESARALRDLIRSQP